eukprot:COSAG01_NODE_41480_length_451_cov_0.585227_1_plen_99_part_10
MQCPLRGDERKIAGQATSVTRVTGGGQNDTAASLVRTCRARTVATDIGRRIRNCAAPNTMSSTTERSGSKHGPPTSGSDDEDDGAPPPRMKKLLPSPRR